MDDIVFVGDWVKDRILGSGSFGVVILWKHGKTEEKLAIKTCKWGDELTEKHKERWTKEVNMLQSCNHQNIVSTRELPSEFIVGLMQANPSKLPILCMEYCSGGDLRQVLNYPQSCCGLAEDQVRQVLGDIKNAIEFLHSNKITHRDLKPENVVMQILQQSDKSHILPQSQTRVIYKLIDLGYAKEIDSKSVCASFVGTLQYLAPEILYSKVYSNSVDYWSLGLLAFEIICGIRPFLPNMAPVQWMPLVKKKSSDHICVFETYHGDINYSSEVFSENKVCMPFKTHIEKWLKCALEWDPKLRGKETTPSKVTFQLPSEEADSTNKVVIFNVLNDILNKKIIRIFSVATLKRLAYEIDANTTVNSLKSWISEDTKLNIEDQLLLSPVSYMEIPNIANVNELCHANANCSMNLYLYSKSMLLKENLNLNVPKSVQRCLEHPKALYNFVNSQVLYKNGLHFILDQKEIYELLITGVYVRAESLKQDSKQLLLKHNDVDKTIGQLTIKQDAITNIIEMGKKHIEHIKLNGSSQHCLGGFEKIFNDAETIFDRICKLRTAWSNLTVRLQSAARRIHEVSSANINSFFALNNYQALLSDAQNAYIHYRKSEKEYRIREKHCHDIMKICYDSLKLRNKLLHEIQRQSCVLKMMDISVEFCKINDVITTASENTSKLLTELNVVFDQLSQCMWTTISILSGDLGSLNDLPYSVVSFEKKGFRIGDQVNNYSKSSDTSNDVEFKSLIENSLKIRKTSMNLSKNLMTHKSFINETSLDFDYLNN